MARYRILNAVSQSFIDVFSTNISGLPAPTSTDVYVRNIDNTITHFVGTNLGLNGSVATTGTVTSVTHTSDVAGTITYEIVDQLVAANNSFASFWNAPSASARLSYATSQNDDGFGSAGVDVINLGIGDNTFYGFQGNDTFVGNTGFDFVSYSDEQGAGGTFGIIMNLSSSAVTATVTGGTFTVAASSGHDAFGFTDTYISIDGGTGTNFVDAFYGNAGDNSFRPYGGNDFVDGGAGFDEWQAVGPSTSGSVVPTQAVTVTYTAGTSFDGIVNNDGHGTSDTFLSIERIRGSSFSDTFNGNEADNSFRGLNGNDTLNGGGGFDEANYSQDSSYGGTAGVIVNLSSTSVTATIGAGTFTVVSGTARDGFGATDTLNSIENARGTSTGDYLVGNAWDNNLRGDGGNDTLIGGDGFDFLTPGSGTDIVNGTPGAHPDQSYDDRDTVSYNDGTNGVGVIVNLSNAAITQTIGAGTFTVAATSARDWSGATDTLIDIERVRGTNQADYIRGSDTANLRSELFDGLAGNDTINGGAGTDTARYDVDDNNGGLNGIIANLSTSSITATIASGTFTVASNTARDGFGDTDTLIGIENIRGTAFNDVFVGSSGSNTFRIQGGNDTIDGGAGIDTVDLFVADDFPAIGATVNLANHTSTAVGGVGLSVLTSIEDVDGSTGADSITGDNNGNYLDGYYGNDTVDGAGGVDIVSGGGGNNSLTGGSEFDYVSYMYDPALAQYYNLQFTAQQPVINQGVTVNLLTHTATNWAGGTDSVNGFEAVVGTFFADNITGDAGDNTFYGLSGSDVIDGGGGNDTVAYGLWDNLGRVSVPLSGINVSNPNGVIVNLGTTAVTATVASGTFTVQGGHAYDGEGGTDTLTSIENITGSQGADYIAGSNGANVIDGGAGRDQLFGGDGSDVIYYDANDDLANVLGGAGVDTLRVINQASPTSFNLAAHEFENANVIVDDTTNQWWSNISDYYNVNWQRTNSDTRADDGRLVQTTFDVSNGGSGVNWQYITDYRNSGNLLTNQDGVFDVNTTFSKSYDYAIGTAIDGISDELREFTYFFRNVTDQQLGNVLNVEGFYDDGRKFTQTNDIDGNQSWTFQTDWYKNDGVTLDFKELHNDNGTTQIIPY